MRPDSSYQLFVGLDRSDATIDTHALAPDGAKAHQQKISTRPERLLDWVGALRRAHPDGRVAVCIEQPCANIASFLGQFEFIDLFLVNPVLIKAYRDSFHTARPKDDKKDACLLYTSPSPRD